MIQATFGQWLFAWTVWAAFFYWIGYLNGEGRREAEDIAQLREKLAVLESKVKL